MNLSFDLVRKRRSSKDEDNCIEAVLNDLITQIFNLSDIRTDAGDYPEVMTRTIAAVRGVKVFAPVYCNPSKTLRELESSLRLCVLEAGRPTWKSSADVRSFTSTAGENCSFQDKLKILSRQFQLTVGSTEMKNETRDD